MYFNCPELLFLFLKGMAGALAPISYLVYYNWVINYRMAEAISVNHFCLQSLKLYWQP
jgi:hypothetical protein